MAEAASGPKIESTGELYRIPFAGAATDEAKVCVRWPRYAQGEFQWVNEGVSMLELTEEERTALVIVVLRTTLQKEKYGGVHHFGMGDPMVVHPELETHTGWHPWIVQHAAK